MRVGLSSAPIVTAAAIPNVEDAEEPAVPIHGSLADLFVEERQWDERCHEPGRPEQAFPVGGFDPVGGVLVGPSEEPALAQCLLILSESCFAGQEGEAKKQPQVQKERGRLAGSGGTVRWVKSRII